MLPGGPSSNSMDPKLTASEFMEALCIYREARGETDAAKAAMLAVIRNRAAQSPKYGWPKNTTGVIVQPWQFSSFNADDPNAKVWPDSTSPGRWQAWLDCCNVVLTPMLADPTDGANHYEAVPDPAKRPKWADPAKMTCEIGKTRFYKL